MPGLRIMVGFGVSGRNIRKRLEQRARILQSARYARAFYGNATRQPYAHQLTTVDKKQIHDYSLSVLGSRIFQPWLRVYTAIHGRFREGWIPEDFYAFVALPMVNGPYRNLSNARSLSRRILATDRIPDLAYFVNGIWTNVAGEFVARNQVKDLLASATHVIVVKPENASQGRGIFCRSVSDLDLSELESLGRLVVQSYIAQHELLESLSPGCLATLRITTGVTSDGSVKILGTYLRMGQRGADVIRSAEALKAVVTADGNLDAFAYAPDYARLEAHPDTGAPFAGFVVPGYASAADLCVSLHRRVPQFTIIGWDLGIEADGSVAVIEWNTDHPDIKFVEAVGGPHLGPLRLAAHANARR